jgi:hypothetical protein
MFIIVDMQQNVGYRMCRYAMSMQYVSLHTNQAPLAHAYDRQTVKDTCEFRAVDILICPIILSKEFKSTKLEVAFSDVT